MSRIGKKPVILEKGVEVKVDGRMVSVKGPKGLLTQKIPEGVGVDIKGEELYVTKVEEGKLAKKANAFQALTRSLIDNMVIGVCKGFEKRLEIIGVGYRSALEGRDLKLSLGYSHPVIFPLPKGIDVEIEKPTQIAVKGIDKQLVGAVAAKIRSFRPPEPYKGKGIRYAGEQVRRKVGKTK
ncbi:MAG: 50S ribosomal protein L6 [Deltaproteobacteria bacterium]|nr:50S ribosomal protein L6 [Deltaproteobacteria bacterium]